MLQILLNSYVYSRTKIIDVVCCIVHNLVYVLTKLLMGLNVAHITGYDRARLMLYQITCFSFSFVSWPFDHYRCESSLTVHIIKTCVAILILGCQQG